MQNLADYLSQDVVILATLVFTLLGLIIRRLVSGRWKRIASTAMWIGIGVFFLSFVLNLDDVAEGMKDGWNEKAKDRVASPPDLPDP